MTGDPLEVLAAHVQILSAQNAELLARVHALEVAAARASHDVRDPPATQPCRTVEDRGRIIHLREPAA